MATSMIPKTVLIQPTERTEAKDFLLDSARGLAPPTPLSNDKSNWKSLGTSKWTVKGHDDEFFIYADGKRMYALTVSSTVKIVDETFGYVKCEKMDKTKTILGLEFSNSRQTKRTFQKIQEVIRILSLKDEWDGISSVHPADSRFFDAFLPDDIWTEYDSKIDMKRPKDYISSRPSDSLACCVAFTCGDEQNALNDRGDIKAGPILEHKLLFNPNDEDDRKHGADWCRARLIALKSIEYPQNWNGENTKEHRKRGGRFVPWDHQVTKLYNRVFPSDVGYTMRRPEQPPSSPGHLDDVLLWRDPVVQYHSFIAQAVDPMMTVTYGNVFTWYRPVTNKQLSSTCPPTKSGEVLHVPCALVILSKFCFTKTTRERILCLPLRRIFGSNEDSKALQAIWSCVMNHSLDCMPSIPRKSARLLHCMSWNPNSSTKDLILKSDSFDEKKFDDSNALESLSERQCKAMLRLVDSRYKFRVVDDSLPSLRKAAAKAFALVKQRKCTPWAMSQGYHLGVFSVFDIVRLETQVYDFQWSGQTVWVNVMRKYRENSKLLRTENFKQKSGVKKKSFDLGKSASGITQGSVYGHFVRHNLRQVPHRCDRKEHRWIVRDFAEGTSTLVKRQCRCCKITMLDNHAVEFEGTWPRDGCKLDFLHYEHFFKFQMLPVVWWLGTNARYSFDEEAENKIESRDPNANPSYYVSSEKEGVRTFEDLGLAKKYFEDLGKGKDKLILKDTHTFNVKRTRLQVIRYALREGEDKNESYMEKFSSTILRNRDTVLPRIDRLRKQACRYWAVTPLKETQKLKTGIRGLVPKFLGFGDLLGAHEMQRTITTICEFVRPTELECNSPIPRVDTPLTRVFQNILPQAMTTIFQALLIDSKVLVISDHHWKLTDALETVMSMMFPFKCKSSIPSYEPLMPVNENLNDYLESPYNFCYGAMKSRVVKDGLMESVVRSRPYRPGDRLVIVDDEDVRDVLSSIVIVDLDIGDLGGQGLDVSTPQGRKLLNGEVIQKVIAWSMGQPITEGKIVSEGLVGESLNFHRFQMLQSFSDELTGYHPNSKGVCRFGWDKPSSVEACMALRTWEDALENKAVKRALGQDRKLVENLLYWEPLPRRYRLRIFRAVQLAYGVNIPSKYRSLIKDSVRSASVAVTSIVLSEEEGQGTSQFPEEYIRSTSSKHRYSIVHHQDREIMVRWSFMEVLTSILKPVRICVNQSYKKHIFEKLKEGKTPRLKEMLNISKFVEMNHVSPGASEELDHAFIKLITETQMFRQFVARYIRLSKRNVFDAWCALKNRTIMMQYEFWKTSGVGERFGCLQKLAKGDDGVHARGGFFGKFKGHKWKKRMFHIKRQMYEDMILNQAIQILFSVPDPDIAKLESSKKVEDEEEPLGDDVDSESEYGYDDGFDGDDTDDETGVESFSDRKRGKKERSAQKKSENEAMFKKEEEMRKKVTKIHKCFKAMTRGIAKDELVLNWFDVEKNHKFRYLVDYIEALKKFVDLSKGSVNLNGVNTADETCDEISKFHLRVKVTGVYNTKIKDETIEKANFQKLLSKEPRQRHYLYTEIDDDGDAMTKKAAWYQVLAWKPQNSDRYSFGIQHNRIREGDYIAIAPQLSMPLVQKCVLNCSPEVLGDKTTKFSRELEEFYKESDHEFVWNVEDGEEHIGDLFLSQAEMKKMTLMGSLVTESTKFMETRIKKVVVDDCITLFPDCMKKCIHTWTKNALTSPAKYKKNRDVFVVDIDNLVSDYLVTQYFPELIVELYAMMAENETSGPGHRFKIVPGSLELTLPSSEYQSRMIEKTETPFYFQLDYKSMTKPADSLLMLTSFNNLDRREWMKAFKAVNYDKAKYEAQNALYKASIDDDPAVLALVSGGVSRSGAILREAKSKYQAIRVFEKVVKNKIDMSKEHKTVMELLEPLICPSKLHGDRGSVMWLKRLKDTGLFDEIYGDLTTIQRQSAEALMDGKPLPKSDGDDEAESNTEETRNALMEFLLDKCDAHLQSKCSGDNGGKEVLRIIRALYGGDSGLKDLKESLKSELIESGVQFKKRKRS